MKNLKIDCEKFGQYDLSSWELVSMENTDADTKFTTYKKGGQTFTIKETNISEYSYMCTYKILNNNNTLKERGFSSIAGDEDKCLINETVYNFTNSKIYSRGQRIQDKYWYELNPKPTKCTGAWEVSDL